MMTHAPSNTQTLRRLGTLAVIGALALTSGCFTSEGGRVGDMVSSKIDPQTGVQRLELDQVATDVDWVDGAIIIDFADAASAGVLSTLDGAPLELSAADLGIPCGASIDPELTNADPAALIVRTDKTGVTIDFDDLQYDDTTFIKIDIRFAEGA